MYVDFAIPFDILSENKGQCQPSVLRGSKEYWINHEQLKFGKRGYKSSNWIGNA